MFEWTEENIRNKLKEIGKIFDENAVYIRGNDYLNYFDYCFAPQVDGIVPKKVHQYI